MEPVAYISSDVFHRFDVRGMISIFCPRAPPSSANCHSPHNRDAAPHFIFSPHQIAIGPSPIFTIDMRPETLFFEKLLFSHIISSYVNDHISTFST
jgi:hypothetical protein